MRRLRLIVALLGVIIASASFATMAWAYFTTTGSGSATGSTATLLPPTAVSATSSGGSVAVSWTGHPGPDGGSVTGYYVQRSTGTPGGTCASSPASLLPASPTSCTDTGMPSASYSYTVVAVFRSWTASASSSPVSVAAVDHFQVSAPAGVTAGAAFTVTVTAQNASNATDTGYLGTVRFSSTDPRAVLPADYTFVPADAGVRVFSSGATLKAAGSGTVAINDVSDVTKTGSTSITVNPAAANKLVFSQQPTSTAAGVAISAAPTVRIEDQFGNLTTSTAGVTLAVTGATATLNGTTTQPGAAGVATYTGLTVTKAGTYTLSATSSGLIGATSTSFTVSAAAATKLCIVATLPTCTGGTLNVAKGSTTTTRARILDQFDNVATAAGEITITLTRTGQVGDPVPATVKITAGQSTSAEFTVTIDSGNNKKGTVTAASTGLTTATVTLQS